MDPSRQLLDLLNGYQVSAALHVAATLGISDLLATGHGTSANSRRAPQPMARRCAD